MRDSMRVRNDSSPVRRTVIGVSTIPGDTQLTRIVGPYSSAAACVSAMTPAFAAA
jgi:hypothetical protein